MGGVAIIVGVVVGYFLTHLIVWRPLTPSGLLILYLMVGLGLVGVADDYLKIFKQRSTGPARAHEAGRPGRRRVLLRLPRRCSSRTPRA